MSELFPVINGTCIVDPTMSDCGRFPENRRSEPEYVAWRVGTIADLVSFHDAGTLPKERFIALLYGLGIDPTWQQAEQRFEELFPQPPDVRGSLNFTLCGVEANLHRALDRSGEVVYRVALFELDSETGARTCYQVIESPDLRSALDMAESYATEDHVS